MSGLKLYEINDLLYQAMEELRRQAEENDGVVADDWSKFADDLDMERTAKLLDIGRYVKNLLAEAEAIKAEKTALAKRQAGLEAHAERMKSYMAANMKPGEKQSDANTRISWRRSEVVIVENIETLPIGYTKITKEPMKKEIKEAIKAGEKIDGARIEEKLNLQIG